VPRGTVAKLPPRPQPLLPQLLLELLPQRLHRLLQLLQRPPPEVASCAFATLRTTVQKVRLVPLAHQALMGPPVPLEVQAKMDWPGKHSRCPKTSSTNAASAQLVHLGPQDPLAHWDRLDQKVRLVCPELQESQAIRDRPVQPAHLARQALMVVQDRKARPAKMERKVKKVLWETKATVAIQALKDQQALPENQETRAPMVLQAVSENPVPKALMAMAAHLAKLVHQAHLAQMLSIVLALPEPGAKPRPKRKHLF